MLLSFYNFFMIILLFLYDQKEAEIIYREDSVVVLFRVVFWRALEGSIEQGCVVVKVLQGSDLKVGIT